MNLALQLEQLWRARGIRDDIAMNSGRAAFNPLSAAYRSYGLWNLLDVERGIVIHHGVGLKTEDFRFGELRRRAPMAPKTRTVENFLLAAPVRMP